MNGSELRARIYFSFSGVILLTGLLYHEVSGGLLTVVWGFEALTCLGCGFPARERILRLQGLALFALCTLKLFLYDLRHLETLYRILSFTALGIILLGVPGCTRDSASTFSGIYERSITTRLDGQVTTRAMDPGIGNSCLARAGPTAAS